MTKRKQTYKTREWRQVEVNVHRHIKAPFSHHSSCTASTTLKQHIMVQLEKLSSNKAAGGFLTKYKFPSASLALPTQFNVFIPSSASPDSPVPVLFYLAGLTCTEDTGAQKGGFLNAAGKEGIALVFPDTSPRGAGVEGEDDDWQLGTGAGFYINAETDKWKKHYNMYGLIVKELPEVLKEANLGLVSVVC